MEFLKLINKKIEDISEQQLHLEYRIESNVEPVLKQLNSDLVTIQESMNNLDNTVQALQKTPPSELKWYQQQVIYNIFAKNQLNIYSLKAAIDEAAELGIDLNIDFVINKIFFCFNYNLFILLRNMENMEEF
jgi:hypothetical protein